jgi:hypothetical protein
MRSHWRYDDHLDTRLPRSYEQDRLRNMKKLIKAAKRKAHK